MKDLSSDVFFKLVDFLEKIDKEDDGDKAMSAVLRLRRFIPAMNAAQQTEMYYIISNRSVSGFEEFKKENPDLILDPKGKSNPMPINAWMFRLQSLDATYSVAKASLLKNGGKDPSKRQAHTQVVEAKELNVIAKMAASPFSKPDFYDTKRFVESGIVKGLDYSAIKSHEDALVTIIPRIHDFFHSFEECCLRRKRKENCELFADNVVSRLEILMQDPKLTDEQNRLYAEKINKIFPLQTK